MVKGQITELPFEIYRQLIKVSHVVSVGVAANAGTDDIYRVRREWACAFANGAEITIVPSKMDTLESEQNIGADSFKSGSQQPQSKERFIQTMELGAISRKHK